MRLSRHLYLKIYLTIVVSLLAVVLVAGLMWRLGAEEQQVRQGFAIAEEMASLALPSSDAPASEQKEAVRRLHERLQIDLALFSSARVLIAAAGREVEGPSTSQKHSGFVPGSNGPVWAITVPDGRWLVARPSRSAPGQEVLGLIGFTTILAFIVALAALPIARQLTGRLERLQRSVEQLGRGNLSARVRVEGRDEVARLAESFNDAAQQIERLVDAHKMLLANASHEIRTPLARIRIGLELLQGDPRPDRRAALRSDIIELDNLIEDILILSRLDAIAGLETREEVELLGLAAEEVTRYDGAVLEGRPVSVQGDPRLLRRLVRNLLDNASRHGRPPINVAITSDHSQAHLIVCDGGPGIPASERTRVFEPFRRLPSGGESGGTGLGLTLVRQIARQHGGDATIEDPGSQIKVRLPRG